MTWSAAVVSIATDLCTESGMADYAHVDVEKWLYDSGLEWATVEQDELVPVPNTDADDVVSQYLFENAIAVLGLLHISSQRTARVEHRSNDTLGNYPGCIETSEQVLDSAQLQGALRANLCGSISSTLCWPLWTDLHCNLGLAVRGCSELPPVSSSLAPGQAF